MKKLIIYFLIEIVLLVSVSLVYAISPPIVISEFKVKGAEADDEFIEIYNTTSSTFNLNGYRLVYRTASGTSDYSIKSWTSDTYIPSYGHYLWGNGDGAYADIADATTIQSLAGTGGGIAIRQGDMNTGTIIDSVGYGDATNDFIEMTPKSPVHSDNKSFERKRSGVSITDTDNNNSDFEEVDPTPMNTSDASLPVGLSSFTARHTDSGVVLKWTTETETEHVGWYIYRSESKDGEFVKVNDELIEGAGYSAMPLNYHYIDKSAKAEKEYYYYLKDLDILGQTGKSQIISTNRSAEKQLTITWASLKVKR